MYLCIFYKWMLTDDSVASIFNHTSRVFYHILVTFVTSLPLNHRKKEIFTLMSCDQRSIDIYNLIRTKNFLCTVKFKFFGRTKGFFSKAVIVNKKLILLGLFQSKFTILRFCNTFVCNFPESKFSMV